MSDSKSKEYVSSKDFEFIARFAVRCVHIFFQWSFGEKGKKFTPGEIQNLFPCDESIYEALNVLKIDEVRSKTGMDVNEFIAYIQEFLSTLFSFGHGKLFIFGFHSAKIIYIVHSFSEQSIRIHAELINCVKLEAVEIIGSLILKGVDEIHEKGDLNYLDNIIVKLFEAVEGGKNLIEAE